LVAVAVVSVAESAVVVCWVVLGVVLWVGVDVVVWAASGAAITIAATDAMKSFMRFLLLFQSQSSGRKRYYASTAVKLHCGLPLNGRALIPKDNVCFDPLLPLAAWQLSTHCGH
jgi:hypothetical protein